MMAHCSLVSLVKYRCVRGKRSALKIASAGEGSRQGTGRYWEAGVGGRVDDQWYSGLHEVCRGGRAECVLGSCAACRKGMQV
jgi:hypothetical protein